MAKHKATGRCLRRYKKKGDNKTIYLCQKPKGHLWGCK